MMKVLIIEDEAIVAMALEFSLVMAGHQVTAMADNLEEACAAIALGRPDIALVDIQLGHGRSGLTIAAELQRRGIPVMFATGNVPLQPRPDLAWGCFPKPYRDEELVLSLEMIERYIAGDLEVLRPMAGFLLYNQSPLASNSEAA